MSHISTTSSLVSCCRALTKYSTDSLSETHEEVSLETSTKVLGAEVGTGGVWVCLFFSSLPACSLLLGQWQGLTDFFRDSQLLPGKTAAFLKSSCLCFSPEYAMTDWHRNELQVLIYYQLLIPLWFTVPS